MIALVGTLALSTFIPLYTSGLSIPLTVAAFTLFLVIGFLIWVRFSREYTFEKDHLKVQSGPFKWDIAIWETQSIQASYSLLSSPELSLKRLEIRYGQNKTFLVSREDQDQMLKEALIKQ